MYVDYKDFINHPTETLENYRDFFMNSFPELLRWYYPLWSNDSRMILDAQNHKNPEDNPCLSDPANRYFFAASVFFINLIPQVITRIAGVEVRNNFLKASGWPMMSAGLGGFISPELWLKESGLVPDKKEADYLKTLLLIVFPWQDNEMKEFVSGSQPSLNRTAYNEFCKGIQDKWNGFEDEFLYRMRQAGYNFLDGNYEVYYLQGDELNY